VTLAIDLPGDPNGSRDNREYSLDRLRNEKDKADLAVQEFLNPEHDVALRENRPRGRSCAEGIQLARFVRDDVLWRGAGP